ncbi:MAG: OadG family protein [Treponema sp.]|jgi:oxaloacetate decarboxylase gamma subunit|nr:OadG family protein [Treponema sp.]
MTIAEMLGQSGVMTLLGMGTVFGFLVILIIAVTVTGKIINALGLNKDAPSPAGKAGSAAPSGAGDAAVTAAISAAVNEYRKNN